MGEQQISRVSPITLFYSYAHEDELLRNQLEKHLSLLRRQGLISEWYDRQILAGDEWAHDIDEHLETAWIILLLISPDFLASDYCYDIEMRRALERHSRGEARVIPIILRPCDWRTSPFAHLQCLPRDGKPITEWDNQDTALREITQGVRRVLEQRATSAHPTPRFSPIDRQSRLRKRKRVRTIWIEGVLEQSLHQAVRIELGLQEQPDALANPWHLVVQETNLPSQQLPVGTRIIQIYDDANGELLILGGPGAGKTTLLLELTRDLLARAELDDTFPIPVVFNLSSWAQKQASLADWLIEELAIKYQIPKKLGRAWVTQEHILPLLDGLDEVREEVREACVLAINNHYTLHQAVSPVVCSRRVEYFAQKRRVAFLCAVSILPLTMRQIDTYLGSMGGQLETVGRILRESAALQELATTPLMLSVLTLAYQGKSTEDILTLNLVDIQQRHLFATYIEQMLTRRSLYPHFPAQQTIQWLSWLARQMLQHNQTEFFVELMQPDWLLSYRRRLAYYTSVGLAIGIPFGLTIGLAIWLVAGPTFGLVDLLLIGTPVGLGFGSIIGLQTEIHPTEITDWSWRKMWSIFVNGLLTIQVSVLVLVFVALLVLVLAFLSLQLDIAHLTGLLTVQAFGLVVGLVGGLVPRLLTSLSENTLGQGSIWTKGS